MTGVQTCALPISFSLSLSLSSIMAKHLWQVLTTPYQPADLRGQANLLFVSLQHLRPKTRPHFWQRYLPPNSRRPAGKFPFNCETNQQTSRERLKLGKQGSAVKGTLTKPCPSLIHPPPLSSSREITSQPKVREPTRHSPETAATLDGARHIEWEIGRASCRERVSSPV